MIEVLSHFLGFFIGFTITLGMIGSILHYLRNYSRESLNLLLFIYLMYDYNSGDRYNHSNIAL